MVGPTVEEAVDAVCVCFSVLVGEEGLLNLGDKTEKFFDVVDER